MARGALVIPTDCSLRARPDCRRYSPPLPLWAIKIKRSARSWLNEWVRVCSVRLIGEDEALPVVVLALILFVAFWRGTLNVPSSFELWGGKQALRWTVLMSLAFAACIATYKVWRSQSEAGQWTRAKFLFNERQFAFTAEWKPEDNGSCKTFSFRAAEPGSLINYKLEFEGPEGRIWGAVLGNYRLSPEDAFVAHAPLANCGKAVIGCDGKLELKCYSMPGSVPAIVRVYVLDWKLFADEWMEFVNTNAATRCVMRGPTIAAKDQ
jgi:hypothetical protein